MNQAPRLILDGDCLRVSGDITAENVLAIRKEGEQLLAARARSPERELVVDLSELGVAHSVVLSLLLCWLRQASADNVSLRLEGVGDRLLSLATLSGLHEHLPGLEVASLHA